MDHLQLMAKLWDTAILALHTDPRNAGEKPAKLVPWAMLKPVVQRALVEGLSTIAPELAVGPDCTQHTTILPTHNPPPSPIVAIDPLTPAPNAPIVGGPSTDNPTEET